MSIYRDLSINHHDQVYYAGISYRQYAESQKQAKEFQLTKTGA
jgi:hypothetical protein